MDVPGADLLMNSAVTTTADTKLPELEAVSLDFTDLPAEQPPPPKLVPSSDEIGVTRSRDGIENLNAEAYFKPAAPAPRVSEDAIVKRKYELLRKFDRLNRLGVPMRKRFTMDSPVEEMELEMEFIRREKSMDSTIKQFSEWFISGMSALEWGSKNVNMMKMFGLQLDGLSQSAQMNVGDYEEDFEELYDLYGDKLRMHPLVRIPMRTCMMVYMVHLTNQMAMKAPVPNIQEILRTNPEIARQMAASAMQQQTAQFKQQAPPPRFPEPPVKKPPPKPEQENPLAGLMSFLGGTNPPQEVKTVREIKPPSNMGISDILKNIQREEKKISTPSVDMPKPALKSALRKSGSSDARKSSKNSVVIKL
ncbi:hypothetical protein EB118_02740 [bacterium]|nr:hypothetical protein [Actinomycetota bacterium]NDG29000.1 hypothetical protein [bacterium]